MGKRENCVGKNNRLEPEGFEETRTMSAKFISTFQHN